MTTDTKPYLSPTQIDMICRCPEQYRRRYIEGERIPPGVAAIQGTAVHDGAAVNFRQKISTHTDLATGDIVDAAVAKFETETAGGFVLSREEESRGASVVLGEAKDQVAVLAELLADEVVEEYQPVFVEQPVRLLLHDASHDLFGILDLADDKKRVIDFKTAGKKKSQDEADHSVQLTYYAAAHRVLTGEAPEELRLEVLVKTKTPQRQTVATKREVADFEAMAHRVNSVLAVIQHGAFMPATPGSWWCSSKWCGYHSTCRFVNHREPATYDITPADKTKASSPTKQASSEIADVDLSSPAETPAAVDFEKFQPNKTTRTSVGKNIKERLWNQSQRKCHWCGTTLTLRTATIDHIVPLAHGGSNREENLCCSCRVCNERRADTGLTPEHAAAAAGAK